MEPTVTDARRDLEAIRDLMERARAYRHLSPWAAWLAGLLALAGAFLTRRVVAAQGLEDSVPWLALIWGGVLVFSVAAQLVLSYRAAQKEGSVFWTPLAVEVAAALWPPFLVACALTWVLVRSGPPNLIAPLWMLCYGVGAMAVGAHARPAVRGLGLAFLAAGVADLVHPVSTSIALGATFGVFHLIYGFVLLRPMKP